MLRKQTQRISIFCVLWGGIILLTGCNLTAQAPTPTTPPTAVPATATAQPPTPTPPPLAARVNGEGIYLEDYQADLKRFKKAMDETGKKYTDEQAAKMVMDNLVANVLLAQAAVQDGYQLDEAALQAKLADLSQKVGGSDKLAAWEQANAYSDISFRRDLQRSLAADWERNHLVNAVPQMTEEIHARQILVKDQTLATQLYEELQAGSKKFEDLAAYYDPLTSGELGWFPRGVLFQPEVEKAVFDLQPGQFSPVVQSSYGFHIVQVIERDPQHTLSSDLRLELQHKLLEAWMKDNLAKSKVEVLVN